MTSCSALFCFSMESMSGNSGKNNENKWDVFYGHDNNFKFNLH